jgi:hypothetical protein
MSSKSSEGKSLVFPLVLMGVIVVTWALLLTTVGKGIFSSGTALSLEGDARGTTGLRGASEQLANDLRDAEHTSLVEEAGWAPSVTLSRTDKFRGVPLPHVVQYTVRDDRLIRTENGVAEAVAEDVVSTSYSLAEGEFSAVFEVRAEPGVIETVTLRIAMP